MDDAEDAAAGSAIGLAAEVIVYGLREKTQFNGRLCTVESDRGTEEPQRRWVLRVLPAQAMINVGLDDALGEQLISPRTDCIFPNTRAGRRRLRAERAADVLALRGCFTEVFGGMTNDLVLRIASWLPAPERLMVFSGYRGKIFNSVYQHSAVSGTWEQPSRMLSPRIDAASVKIDETRLLFAGGVNGHPMRPQSQVQQTAQLYDALTNAWTELPPMLSGPRHGCGGALLDGLVYVVGGSYAARSEAPDPSSWKDSTEVFDLATQEWRQVAAPSADKVFPAVGAVGGRIVVAGGESSSGPDGANAGRHVEAFDPTRGTWTDCAPMLTTRSACGFTVWEGALVVCGGRGGAGEPLSSVESFDGTEWRTLPDMIESRLGPALAVVNGVMHAIGGVCDNGQGGWGAHGGGAPAGAEPFTAEVERYDPEAGRWVACPHMVAPVAYHACFAEGLAPLYD